MSFNNSEIIESIDSIEIYVYGSKEVPVYKKKEIKCNDKKKTIQKWTVLAMLQRNT